MKKFTIFAILMALGMPVIAQRYTTPKTRVPLGLGRHRVGFRLAVNRR